MCRLWICMYLCNYLFQEQNPKLLRWFVASESFGIQFFTALFAYIWHFWPDLSKISTWRIGPKLARFLVGLKPLFLVDKNDY